MELADGPEKQRFVPETLRDLNSKTLTLSIDAQTGNLGMK